MRSAELQNQWCSSKITDEEELYHLIVLFLGEVRGFSRVRREFSAEGRQKPETALEKSLAPRVAAAVSYKKALRGRPFNF